MKQDQIVADEQILNYIGDIVKKCAFDISEQFEMAISKAKALSSEWDDDDFTEFLSFLTAFRDDLEIMNTNANRIVQIASDKIELIHALHKLISGGTTNA